MDSSNISFVLSLHSPFPGHLKSAGTEPNSYLENIFFETLAETIIPLVSMFDRLDGARIPFRMALAVSPVLSQMLNDEALIKKYLDYTDRQIEFGYRELSLHDDDFRMKGIVKYYYDQIVEKRILFTERYGKNIVKVLDQFQQKGRLEILNTAASHAFLPFYLNHPGAIQAEIETAIGLYRKNFGKYPQGFWLPELGWIEGLDSWLRSYNFAYTLVDSHALVLGEEVNEKGSFFPVRTPSGVFILGRDYYACNDIDSFSYDPVYRDNLKDLGFELSEERLGNFLSPESGRCASGIKYSSHEGRVYDPDLAGKKAEEYAALFLQKTCARLSLASSRLNAPSISLCAFEADRFGKRWYEGFHFLETLFRINAGKNAEQNEAAVQFASPADYLFRLDSRDFQVMLPGFSSAGKNGYAEAWIDSSSGWMYRHTMRALDRMVEVAERFPDDTGLNERVLNQAAREILLLLSSDWPKMLGRQECSEFIRNLVESFLRNFTTIYEALGSNSLSTEWLTRLEKAHNIFPNINYRVFRRKLKPVNGKSN